MCIFKKKWPLFFIPKNCRSELTGNEEASAIISPSELKLKWQYRKSFEPNFMILFNTSEEDELKKRNIIIPNLKYDFKK